MSKAPEGSLHHLPSRRDHTIYILALALAPIVNLAVRAFTFKFFWESVAATKQQVMPPDPWIFSLLSAPCSGPSWW